MMDLKRFAERMDRMLTDAMTSTVEAPPPEPFSLAKLRETIDRLGPPPPRNLGKIVESVYMVDRYEDWSKARSPSRTKRRMRYNAARIYTYTPKKEALQMPDGSLVMHPAMAAQLRAKLAI